uniref:MULE transposase domain-containing protein n=1 Tax=Lactuca sativa TaxID=4236 RepID=A0A9R1X0E9_LACSA|nr:hypothetical protein LSAT_V11C800426050 [Lactuca sativa]
MTYRLRAKSRSPTGWSRKVRVWKKEIDDYEGGYLRISSMEFQMASTSRTKKPKGTKLREKTYLPESDSDDDAFDFSFLDFSEETFKSPSRLCDDQFLNLLYDENILRRSIDGMVDDGDIPGVQQKEHAHLDEDNEDVGVEYRVHDPNVDWKEMRPQLGDCYESLAQLRFDLTNYVVHGGYQLYFEKSDRVRDIAKCGSGNRDINDNNKMQCPFRVAAGWKYNERIFQIKFCNEMHLCARNYHFGSLVTSNWLAKHYLKDVIMKPKMTLLEMHTDVLQRFSVSVSLGKCQRAKATAMGMIEVKLEDHYANVLDYTAAIRLSNPGTTFLKVSRGCKKVIVLDGSFLKGQVKGEILTAIGRDAHNHVYLIAWAVVNVENKDNWTWFIDNLVVDLDLGAGNGLVVISDQHKVEEQHIEEKEAKEGVKVVEEKEAEEEEVEEREVEEQLIEEGEVDEGVEEREVEEEVEGIQVEEEEVESIVVEEEGVEERQREVGARVLPSKRSYGAYNFHWEKKSKPSERIRKMKLRKMVEDADGGGSSKTSWVLE